MEIDTLVLVIADQNGGKSNQIRSVFEEHELYHVYGGYPASNNIARRYLVEPDVELFLRLSSWHEKQEAYTQVKQDILGGRQHPMRRYKVCAAAQVTATSKLVGGEELFTKLFADFDIRRGYAVWLNPDRSANSPFQLSPQFAAFLSANRRASALAIDAQALHPSANPKANSINARLLADILFRT